MKAVIFLIASAFCPVLPLGAQQPSKPPAVLRIFREDIKEGKSAAHEKTEAAFMQAAAKEQYPANILGLTSMTGTSVAVFLEGHATFASIADSQQVIDKPEFAALDTADAELRTSQRSILAVYRPDLSYAVDKINLLKTRFFSIETIRIREGQGQGFTELGKTVIDAAGKSGDTQPVAAYEAVSGAPNGTYLLLEPRQSLKSLDDGLQHQRALFQAMGDEGMKRFAKAVSETVANQESLLFAVNPQMSYVPREWITADPDFWTPKPVETTKAPAKTSAKAGNKASPKTGKKSAPK